MIFYWIIFFVLFFLALPKGSKVQSKCFYFGSILLLFLGATRGDNVGMDINGYSIAYSHISLDTKTWNQWMLFEPGFNFMMALYKKYISVVPLSFFHFIFIVYIVITAWFFKKYTKFPAFALFLLYGLTYYLDAYNTMRQSLGLALCLISFPMFLSKKKYIKFAISIVVISLLFHKSLLLLLLFIPCDIYRESKFFSFKYMSIFVVAALIIGIFLTSAVGNYLVTIGQYVSNERYNGYVTDINEIGETSNVANIAHTIMCLVVMFYLREKRDSMLNIYAIGTIICNLLSPILWIYTRLSDNLIWFRIVPMTTLWFSLNNSKNKYIYRIILLTYIFFRFNGRLLRDSATGMPDIIPYTNVLLSKIF